jgi:hypothetical protein
MAPSSPLSAHPRPSRKRRNWRIRSRRWWRLLGASPSSLAVIPATHLQGPSSCGSPACYPNLHAVGKVYQTSVGSPEAAGAEVVVGRHQLMPMARLAGPDQPYLSRSAPGTDLSPRCAVPQRVHPRG